MLIARKMVLRIRHEAFEDDPEIASGVYQFHEFEIKNSCLYVLIPTTTLSGSIRSCLFAASPTNTDHQLQTHHGRVISLSVDRSN